MTAAGADPVLVIYRLTRIVRVSPRDVALDECLLAMQNAADQRDAPLILAINEILGLLREGASIGSGHPDQCGGCGRHDGASALLQVQDLFLCDHCLSDCSEILEESNELGEG